MFYMELMVRTPCYLHTCAYYRPNAFQVSYMEHGPVPDVAVFIQKVEQEKMAKERGETKDNRSFIAKYVTSPHSFLIVNI